MRDALLGLAAGFAAGAVLSRAGLCFNCARRLRAAPGDASRRAARRRTAVRRRHGARGGCLTGTLWKAGSGAAAPAIAIAGFLAAGELVIRGPGSGLIDALDDGSRPPENALPELLNAG